MEFEISMPDELFLKAALLANKLDITMRELFCRAVSDYVKGCESGGQDSCTAGDREGEDSSVADVWVKMEWASVPVDLHRKDPTKDNPYPYCLCGCGAENTPGSRFNPGHDAKLKSILGQVESGELSADYIPDVLIEATRRNPELTVIGYTAEDILKLASDKDTRENQALKRGEIWGVSLPEPSGSGTSEPRAVLVIQSNGFNRGEISTAIVAVVTSDLDLIGVPGNVFLDMEESGLSTDSVVNVLQILTLDKALFKEPVRMLKPETMSAVDVGLRAALG